MSPITAVSKAITNLNEAERQFKLTLTANPDFFPEWQTELPPLSVSEQEACDRLKNRYLYYAADGAISEGTVHYIMLSPLLEILHLYDPPYKVRAEKSVAVAIATEEMTLEGRIDALVIQEQLWIILIEAKQYGFSVLQAVPQALAYMMANPQPDRPIFALVTTGEDFLFLKRQGQYYAQSYKFTLLSDAHNNLWRVLQVLKRITACFC